MLGTSCKHELVCRWEKEYRLLDAKHDRLEQYYHSLHREHLGAQMLLMDTLFPSIPTPNGSIRRNQSPQTGSMLNLSHPAVLAHRAFNYMDRDADGVIGWADIVEWSCIQIKSGTPNWPDLWYQMKNQDYPWVELSVEDQRELIDWQARQIWAMISEALAPVSKETDWQVCRPFNSFLL